MASTHTPIPTPTHSSASYLTHETLKPRINKMVSSKLLLLYTKNDPYGTLTLANSPGLPVTGSFVIDDRRIDNPPVGLIIALTTDLTKHADVLRG